MTDPDPAVAHQAPLRSAPWTLWIGLGLIGLMHSLLWLDVALRDGAVIPYDLTADDLPTPDDALAHAARWAAANMTPVCWVGYLLLADGLLTLTGRLRHAPTISSLRVRPNRFIVIWLTSIPVWCFFDWVNFAYMDAWRYHGLDPQWSRRVLGYFIAFAAITPGMLMAGQLYQHLGLKHLRIPAAHARPTLGHVVALIWVLIPPLLALAWAVMLLLEHGGWRSESWFIALSVALFALGPVIGLGIYRSIALASGLLGVGMLAWVFAVRDPMGNLALWLGVLYLLDPLNRMMGQPSLLSDWLAGRLGRTLALMAGGLTCGLLWEFWNYWAIAKWTYNLPFLGAWEQVRYFEMPLPGMGGFLPFAAECWVAAQFAIGLLALLRLHVAEPLGRDDVI